MGKKRKHEENGMTSMPRDEMPLGRSSDASHYSFCDALKQFEKHIQVKVNTDELVQKLELRVQKLEDKAKVNTDELVQKLELRVQKLEDKVKRNKNKEVQEKERISKIEEDLRTELNEFKKELRFEFHQEIRKLEENIENRSSQRFSVLKQDFKKELEVKDEPSLGIQEEGWAKVHHLNESPSLRSQPHQSETTRFKLKIQNKVDQIVYKGKPIRTDDSEHITVVLYDGDNPIAVDHHLASALVQLVVVDGEFNELQGFWSKDDFEKKITIRRQGSNTNLVKNGIFQLAGGKCRHEGVTITDNSNRREFMLGAMIVGDTDERVLEGLSNTFRVQEAKTEKDRAKRNTDDSTQGLLRYTTGQVHMTNKNGQGQRYNLQQTRPNFPSIASPLQRAYIVQAANKRHSSGSVGSLMANGLPQQGTSQLENCGQVQQFQTTGQGQHYQTAGPMLSFMQNQSHITYGPTAGNGSVGPPFDNLQLYATQQSAQLKNYGQGRQHTLATPNNVPPPRHVTPSQRTYAHVPAGNGPGGELVERVPRQNATQQGVQLDNHGNGSVDPVPVGHLQQYPTQQSTMQLDNHGQGRQHNSGIPTTQVNSVFMSNLPQRDHLLQQNTTQQGVQLESHGSDLGLDLGLSTHITTGPSAGDVLDNSTGETLRHFHDNLPAPDDPEYLGLLSHVAADQGVPSAGTRQWGTNQLHTDYSTGMHLSGFHPPTEDGGSTVSAPAPEGTQMDFTQA